MAHARKKIINEIRRLVSLGGPLVVSNIAIVSMGVTDTIVAGRASATDLAGLAIGSGAWVTLTVIIMGLLAATSPIVARLRGARKLDETGWQLSQSLWIATVMGLFGVAVLLASPVWTAWINAEPEVRDVTTGYLLALSTGAMPFAVSAALRGYCEGMARVRPTMRIYIAMAILNVPLDILLVFGAGPIPALGGAGCGWATSIACWFSAIAFWWHIKTDPAYRPFELTFRLPKPDWPTLKHHLSIGLPVCVGSTGEVVFFASMAFMLASHGTAAVASHQVAISIGSTFYMVALALAQAVSIRCAQRLGEGKPKAASFSCWTGVTTGIAYAVMTAIIIIVARDWFVLAYTSDKEVFAVATSLLLLCAAFQLADVAQAMAWGALRGYKDTRTPMFIQLFSYWLVGFPIARWLGENYWGVYGYWVGINAGLMTAALLLNYRLWRTTQKERIVGVRA